MWLLQLQCLRQLNAAHARQVPIDQCQRQRLLLGEDQGAERIGSQMHPRAERTQLLQQQFAHHQRPRCLVGCAQQAAPRRLVKAGFGVVVRQLAVVYLVALALSLLEHLETAWRTLRGPLAVRSSSLLEDAQFRPFAGIYDTYKLTNQHPSEQVRFEELLPEPGEQAPMTKTDPAHLSSNREAPPAPRVDLRNPGTSNGINDVEIEQEMVELSENSVHYQAISQLVAGRYRGILEAIRTDG